MFMHTTKEVVGEDRRIPQHKRRLILIEPQIIVGVNYLRETEVWDNLRQINNELRLELETLELLHNDAHPTNGAQQRVVAAWDEFFPDFLREIINFTQTWVRRWHDEAVQLYGRNDDEASLRFIRTVRRLLALALELQLPLEDLGSRRD